MTVWDTLGALLRRWYVVLLGIAATGAALYGIQTYPAVYFSRATVFFVGPSSEANPNELQVRLASLITTAGVVGNRIATGSPLPKATSSDVTLVGRGVYDGVLIKLPDNGGQWSAYYDTQALDVQVSAPTPELVRQRQEAVFELIATELAAMQDEAVVPRVDRITTEIAPATPPILELRGQRTRSRLATVAIGGISTLLLVALLERRAMLRRRRPRADASRR